MTCARVLDTFIRGEETGNNRIKAIQDDVESGELQDDAESGEAQDRDVDGDDEPNYSASTTHDSTDHEEDEDSVTFSPTAKANIEKVSMFFAAGRGRPAIVLSVPLTL